MSIPHPECLEILKHLIRAKALIAHELHHRQELNASGRTDGLSLAIALREANAEQLPDEKKGLKRFFLTDSAFTEFDVPGQLGKLLSADEHLQKCCITAWGLARAIELLDSDPMEASSAKDWDEARVDKTATQVMAKIYEHDYARGFFVRLYNLDSDLESIKIPAFETEIVRLHDQHIPQLIGETSINSSLHFPETGSLFLKFIDNGMDDDSVAFGSAWSKAQSILKILRYIKYGNVDVDYAGVYYGPEWVTQLRRSGIKIWGRPRTDRQDSTYRLTASDVQKFYNYCLAYKNLEPLIVDPNVSSLRLANSLAGNYYEGHYSRQVSEKDQKLLDLVTALEIMFSPGFEGELTFRLAQRAAVFLGKDIIERKEIKNLVKNVYRARGQLVHSGISPFNPPHYITKKMSLSDDDLATFGDYIRQAVLRMLTLVWKENRELKELHVRLDDTALDETLRDELLSESDFETSLIQLIAPKAVQ